MEWTMDARVKLALMVRDRCMRIEEEGDIRDVVERRIYELLEPLGFQATKDWDIESISDVIIFRDSPTHLWFSAGQGKVVKISKEEAEKVMVLGIP